MNIRTFGSTQNGLTRRPSSVAGNADMDELKKALKTADGLNSDLQKDLLGFLDEYKNTDTHQNDQNSNTNSNSNTKTSGSRFKSFGAVPK